jgi:signal transduction histidine kinase/ActR/RegA family two-component response regulator
VATRRLRPSLVSSSVVLILVVVAVAGFGLTRRNNDQQEQALLQSNTSQAAAFASQIFSGLATSLSSVAAMVTSTNGSPTAFEHAEAVSPSLALLLVKKTGAAYVVTAASGGGFHPGQVLEGDALSTVEHAGAKLIAGPVDFNGKLSTARFAIGAPTVPAGLVIYEQFTLDPYTATPVTIGKPFDPLKAKLYGAGPIDVHHLLISTSNSVPLNGQVARATVTVGSSDWTLVAAARRPFIGGFAKSSPIILLVLGLLMAFIIGITIEILARRRHYAEALVEERTLELTAAQAAAEEASRSKSQFLSRMSHELRTPLNAVLGFGQLLEIDELSDAQRDAVDHILKGGRHLLDLINEVLDISRIEAGELSLSSEAVLAADLVRETVDLIRPLADHRGIQLVVDGSGSCDCYMFADRQRVKQVLLNLLSNAVKYNRPRGTIVVSCEQPDATRVRISVADTGMGIPAERLGLLFTPFERLGAEQTAEEGTGIGLALSKRLAEAMGGTLGAASTLGQGSTFTVELPRVEGPVERYERLNGGTQTAVEPAAQRRVVLHIEDNLSNLTLIERVLAQRPGVEVVAAMQGRLALELAREHHPVLVLLDLHLPDMGGEQVLQRLRDDPDTASIPVVIVSADATPGRVQRLLSAGAAAYLPKPIDVRELLRLIDEAVEDR